MDSKSGKLFSERNELQQTGVEARATAAGWVRKAGIGF
jgi:hypothetical protein